MTTVIYAQKKNIFNIQNSYYTGLRWNSYNYNLPVLSVLKKDTISFSGSTSTSAPIDNSVLTFKDLALDPSKKFDRTAMDIDSYKLALMAKSGIPIASGFVIQVKDLNNKNIKKQIHKSVKNLEKTRKLGDEKNPLILSVKQGGSTVYVGLNDKTVSGLLSQMNGDIDKEKYIYDLYQTSISSFGTTIFGIDPAKFSKVQQDILDKNNLKSIEKLTSAIMRDEIIPGFKNLIEAETGKQFPDDVNKQVELAVLSKPKTMNTHPVIVKSVNLNNTENDTIIGVCLSRNPQTGENNFSGDFLKNASGNDLIKGKARLESIDILKTSMPDQYADLVKYTRTIEALFHKPQSINFTIENGSLKINSTHDLDQSSKAVIKSSIDMYNEKLISDRHAVLNIHLRDLDDSITSSFDPNERQDAINEGRLLTKGTAASGGATSGQVVFDTKEAKDLVNRGVNIILIKKDTNAEDVEVMVDEDTKGVVILGAGLSSHASVIAKGLDKPCIVGCNDLRIDNTNNTLIAGDTVINEGDTISIDGASGEIYKGEISTIAADPPDELFEILDIADKYAPIKILANAETEKDIELANKYGAKGIGLCRTEHMFFADDNLNNMQRLILADSDHERNYYLDRVKSAQYDGIREVFQEMDGNPVTIRLLDPPLNEFLPKSKDLIKEIHELKEKSLKSKENLAELEKEYQNITAKKRKKQKQEETDLSVKVREKQDELRDQFQLLGELLNKKNHLNSHINSIERNLKEKEELLAKVEPLEEANPMMGKRGCRLGITKPEIYKMQVETITDAYAKLIDYDYDIQPEIMIPMVSDPNELKTLIDSLRETAKKTLIENSGYYSSEKIDDLLGKIKFGTMIEVPRAALMSGDLAQIADFFCFGTNDLTQFTFGFSRDDARKGFLMQYLDTGIMQNDPFEVLDQPGVGKLIEMSIQDGRKINPNLPVGICGEQGRDPSSMKFLKDAGINYISSSPSGIPKLRLQAGKLGIKETQSTSFSGSSKTAKNFTILENTLDKEFEESLAVISKKGEFTAKEIKRQIEGEYGEDTANILNISGEKVGYSNLVILIPGIKKNGTVPGLFPIIRRNPDKWNMGGGHWRTEEYLLENIIPSIKEKYPDFSFEQVREEKKLMSIRESEDILPYGVNTPRGSGNFSRWNHPDAFDDSGYSNYASIHGFIVFDGKKNNYMILDNKYGIKEFVQTNQKLFDEMQEKFNLKGIIIGGEAVLVNEKLAIKEKNDRINQILGELSMSNVKVTECPDPNNRKEINSFKLIELATNPMANSKYSRHLGTVSQ